MSKSAQSSSSSPTSPMQETVCTTLWRRPIRGSSHRGGPQRMALEMEMLAYARPRTPAEPLRPLGLHEGDLSPADLMKRVCALVPEAKLKTDTETGVVTGVELPGGANFSLEPGGQVEYSSRPHVDFPALVADVSQGLRLLESAAAGRVLFASHGTNPVAPAHLPLLVPKARYLILDRYFASQPGGRGVHMMRHTCTVQPNLDVHDDEDWNEASRLTFLLTPFVRHLFANSAWFQNRPSEHLSERQAIWRETDASRSGIPPEVPFAADVACAYGTWARQAGVFLVPSLPLEEQPLFGELSFEQWLNEGYKGTRPTLHEWETHLATLFPELRLRGFLEVRNVDAQAFEHTLAPVAFWSGLLQSQEGRRRARDFLVGVSRTYVQCQAGASAGTRRTEEVSEEACLRLLLSEHPDHPLFRDIGIHRRLLRIAQDSLAQRHELVGAKSLEAYRAHIDERGTNVAKAESAQEFLRGIVTEFPAREFLKHVESAATAWGPMTGESGF